MSTSPSDPILLAAEARPVIQKLHQRGDVVVRFKSNRSGYAEDELDELDEKAPGHFRVEQRILTLNLDTLIGRNEYGQLKPLPRQLREIEDFRKFPVLAGVAAHESAHARYSLWDSKENPMPKTIPNPDFDPSYVVDEENPCVDDYKAVAEFPVSRNGKLYEMAKLLEEPRVERLGLATFSKTFRRGMQLSATHLIFESIEEQDQEGKGSLESAVALTILVGGRVAAGTLGFDPAQRKAVNKVLASAQLIIETALEGNENAPEDPFHEIQGIISNAVFSNSHTDATPHLEAARKILAIIEPEKQSDPDKKGKPEEEGEGGAPAGMGPGESGAGGEGDESEGEGSGKSAAAAALEEALGKMQGEMKEAMAQMAAEMAPTIEAEAEAKDQKQEAGGYGSVMFKNPRAPQVYRHDQPTQEDRDLYRTARDWMERQIQPTVTEEEFGQWLPTGGARLDVRTHVRDNLAERHSIQRSDWERVSETVKPAPPVKVAIMLDGSGSMSPYARKSASIAWAASNAAADLPESRTVSVVYGNAAAVTQQPGHQPSRTVAISNCDGGTESFIEAANLVEEALWLDDPIEEGERSNVLIIVVSDLMYGGYERDAAGNPVVSKYGIKGQPETQTNGFIRITKDWAERGYSVLVVGANPRASLYGVEKAMKVSDIENIELVTVEKLFR